MARKSKIKYDPTKTVEENARLNNVTKDGIYYYLRTNGIERKEDRLDNLIAEITKAIKANPTASQAEIARITGRSVTTINKYWKICKGEENAPKISRNKFPKTDIKRLGINPDIFNEIIVIEDFTPTIAEPYRIDGIGGIKTIQTNIYNDDFPKSKFDIVTIPTPTKTLPNILNQCLKVCKNKVALLLPIRYLTDPSIFKTHPLFRLYVIPNSNYAWYVWAKNYDGATEIKWLNSTETTETENEALNQLESVENQTKTNRIYGIIGAIIGDIAGSRFESKKEKIPKRYGLYTAKCTFTDDSAMTVAIADSILHKKTFAESMMQWGRLYPHAGYGSAFKKWLKKGDSTVQNHSAANGSGMRIAPVGFYGKSLDEVLTTAKDATIPTHNSKEGIDGAQAIAASVFLARNGKSKAEIKKYIKKQFNYNLDLSFEEVSKLVANPLFKSELACNTVPLAVMAFLNGTDYEDVIRKAIAYHCDADTVACMAGAIAAAFYGVPIELAEQAAYYLPKNMLDVINEFDGTSFTNHRVTPSMVKAWDKNTIVVYGTNAEDNNGEEGYYDTHWSPKNKKVLKGFPIHTIGCNINDIKNDIKNLIKEIDSNPQKTYLIRRVGLSEKSNIGINTIAPLFAPLLAKENVYFPKAYWDYYNKEFDASYN